MVEKLKRGALGWWSLLILAVLPLLLWWLPYGGPMAYTHNAVALATLFAKSGGLVGTALMALSVVMSARFKLVEKAFGGLDKMYLAHHIVGALGFNLIIVHLLFVSLRVWLRGGWHGLQLLWLGGAPAILLGIAAFAALTLITVLTVMVRLRYQTFLIIHRLLGIVFLAGSLHAFLVQAQMATNLPLRLYMTLLTLAALAAYVYHSLLGQVFIRYKRYRLQRIRQVDDITWELHLRRIGRPLQFRAGQFAYVSFRGVPELGDESHPFGIASGERDGDIRLVIKREGDYTAKLGSLRPGALALLEGPFGAFDYRATHHRRQVWIAGGIGIAPFLSMAASLRKGYKIDLYYCARSMAEATFLHELQTIAKHQPGLRVISVCEDTDGFLTMNMVRKTSGELANKAILFCGPPVMTDALRAQCRAARVPERNVYYEDFSF